MGEGATRQLIMVPKLYRNRSRTASPSSTPGLASAPAGGGRVWSVRVAESRGYRVRAEVGGRRVPAGRPVRRVKRPGGGDEGVVCCPGLVRALVPVGRVTGFVKGKGEVDEGVGEHQDTRVVSE